MLKRSLNNIEHNSLQVIIFIIYLDNHWGLGKIDFQQRAIYFGDSLSYSIPHGYARYILYFLNTFFCCDVTKWDHHVYRIPVPYQQDNHSCGIIAATTMERLWSQNGINEWSPEYATSFRIEWLSRIILTHQSYAVASLLTNLVCIFMSFQLFLTDHT
jgi:Ulp1 family protease